MAPGGGQQHSPHHPVLTVKDQENWGGLAEPRMGATWICWAIAWPGLQAGGKGGSRAEAQANAFPLLLLQHSVLKLLCWPPRQTKGQTCASAREVSQGDSQDIKKRKSQFLRIHTAKTVNNGRASERNFITGS